MRETIRRRRALLGLLHNIRNRYALARNPLVSEAWNEAMHERGAERTDFLHRLPGIVESLVDELGSESGPQRRRFDVLRRIDIQRERHDAIARDVGLSRSQLYRDLAEARERLMQALEDRFGLPSAGELDLGPVRSEDVRFAAIDTLRDGGQFQRAGEVANAIARDGTDAAQRVRALCVRAEVETELGAFAAARETAIRARSLIIDASDDKLRNELESTCDLVEFETAHCQGEPVSEGPRGVLIDRLRRHRDRPGVAVLLVRALVGEASLLFERDRAAAALSAIEEAASLVKRHGLNGTRLAVDVEIRASGIRALQADRVASALGDAAKIVEMGHRSRDVRTLRLGMQMMSAHLLTLGRLEESRRFAVDALALIDLFGSPLDRSIVLSNLARIDVHRGDAVQALRWIETAGGNACHAFSITQALAISYAEALVLVEQPDRAVVMARSLGNRLWDWPRLAGRAKLAEATALSALRREREARDCSEQAVAFSHGTAGPLLHLRALDLNVRLTGDARSRATLRELQEALSA